MHQKLLPKILYLGTPVVLISTLNEDGSPNLAPISSAWWLGHACMFGMGTRSKTVENLKREGQCVLNIPSADMVAAVDRLALTTGKNPLPDYKIKMGFEHVPDKFSRAGLTPLASETVRPPRVLECPIQLEANVRHIHYLGEEGHGAAAVEATVVAGYFEENILNPERRHHVDPERWRPLIMSFCEFYDLGQKAHHSRLAEVF
ncbi:MAG: flavin reductase family protein [Calditrichaeota bacterium]|nr:flavin reductase family protein [Calditrichota bacterium]